MANKDKQALQKQLGTSQQEYNQYSPQYADLNLWGVKNAYNQAGAMFEPDWYQGAEERSQNALSEADLAQQRLAQQGRAFDEGADRFDQFAGGAGTRMQPGIDKQQGQADWLWQHPGYTDQEKQAMDATAAAPIVGAYNSAQGELQNHAGRSGNSAGLAPQMQEMARGKARDLAFAGLNNQSLFGQARVAGQHDANQAQSDVNTQRRAGVETEGNLMGTGANIRSTGANIHLGEAGSQLERSKTAQGAEGMMQGAVNLGLEPARLAGQQYGTVQQGRTGTFNPQTTLATQQGFLKQLALAGASGLASSVPGMFGGGGGKKPAGPN